MKRQLAVLSVVACIGTGCAGDIPSSEWELGDDAGTADGPACRVVSDVPIAQFESNYSPPAVAANSEGTPRIAWPKNDHPGTVAYAVRDGEGWDVQNPEAIRYGWGIPRVALASSESGDYLLYQTHSLETNHYRAILHSVSDWSHVRSFEQDTMFPRREAMSVSNSPGLSILATTGDHDDYRPVVYSGAVDALAANELAAGPEARSVAVDRDNKGASRALYRTADGYRVSTFDGQTSHTYDRESEVTDFSVHSDQTVYLLATDRPEPTDEASMETYLVKSGPDAGDWTRQSIARSDRTPTGICERKHPDAEEGTTCSFERTVYPAERGAFERDGDSLVLLQVRRQERGELERKCRADRCGWDDNDAPPETESALMVGTVHNDELEWRPLASKIPGHVRFDAEFDAEGTLHTAVVEPFDGDEADRQTRYLEVSCR